MAVAKLLVKEGADVNGKTAAELLVLDDFDGLLQEDTELQQLLARTDTR